MGMQLMSRRNNALKLAHYVRNLRPGVTEYMVRMDADRVAMTEKCIACLIHGSF